MGVDIIGSSLYNNNIMEIDNSPIKKYILVDWSRPPAHERISPKPIEMSVNDAHSRNQGFSMNAKTKRYVRSEV